MDIAAIPSGVGSMNGPIRRIAPSCELLPHEVSGQKDILFEG